MYPELPTDNDRLSHAISESRRLIEATKRLLKESSEVLVPRETDPDDRKTSSLCR